MLPDELPHLLTLVCLFLLLVSVVHHYAQKTPLVAESWLLLIGVGYGAYTHYFAQGWPTMVLEPEWVKLLVIPVLIFASGSTLRFSQLRRDQGAIFLLALPGVILTLFLIGAPIAWMMSIPLSHGLLFAAAVAATDPSAVAAVFKHYPIPERLAVMIEGESLFNDATAIVIFSVMVSLVVGGAELDLLKGSGTFLWMIAGAGVLGAGLGWFAGKTVSHWKEQNRFAGLTMTVVLAYSSFLLAELIHVSGVIAVLFSALVFVSIRCNGESPKETEMFSNFWAYLSTLSGSLLFFSLGAATGAHEFPLTWAIGGVVVIMLLSRLILIFFSAAMLRAVGNKLPLVWLNILNLSGLRGAVSAALVLMIPESYDQRMNFLCLAFVLCFFSLIVMPPVLAHYLKKHPELEH